MLTLKDVERIRVLKRKGFSKHRTARELGFNVKTVTKYWGEGSLSLTAFSNFSNDYFAWGDCSNCAISYPTPKFLYTWQCPGCGKRCQWKSSWYSKRVKDSVS